MLPIPGGVEYDTTAIVRDVRDYDKELDLANYNLVYKEGYTHGFVAGGGIIVALFLIGSSILAMF